MLFGRVFYYVSRVRVGIVVVSGRPELLAVARDAWGAARLPREGAVALARHAGHDVLVQLGPLITVVAREDPDNLVRRRADLRGRAGVGLADQRALGAIGGWLSSLIFWMLK